jgi:hypothetical protein
MASAGAMDCSPPTSAAATGRQYILTAGTRLSYSLPAVLPNDATRHDSHRFGRALSDDTPTRAHFAHRVEIRRRIRVEAKAAAATALVAAKKSRRSSTIMSRLLTVVYLSWIARWHFPPAQPRWQQAVAEDCQA